MRSLLDVREQYLNEFSFPDPYAEVCFHCVFLLFRTVIEFSTRNVRVKSNCAKYLKYQAMKKRGKETRQSNPSFCFGFAFAFSLKDLAVI